MQANPIEYKYSSRVALPNHMSRLTRVVATLAFLSFVVPAGVIAQQAPDEIKLLLGDVSLQKLFFVMAYDEGIFTKNGLSVTPLFTPGSVATIRRSGVDVAEEFIYRDGPEPPIQIGGASPNIVALTTRAGEWDPVILGSTHPVERWRIVSGPGITSAEQLKGKRIGFSGVGAVSHLAAISFARAMGWDPKFDVSLMSGGMAVEALQAGHVDAFVADELHETMAVAAGFKTVVDLTDYNLPSAGSAFLVDREWLKNNHDAARRFIRSTVEALALLKTDKQAAFRAMQKWYNMKDPALLEYFYKKAEQLPRKPYAPVEGLKKVMQYYDSHEMRKYTLEHFYDDSFILDLDESGYIDSLYRK